MIIDKLSNVGQLANLGSHFKKAVDFMQNTDLKNLENGKYPIDGENVFASVFEYDTKGREEGKWEAHRNYIDIQYMVTGSEKMGYCCIDEMKVTEEYNEEKDILFLDGNGDFLTVREGMFTLFAPDDVHMPGVILDSEQHVKKLVVKILID